MIKFLYNIYQIVFCVPVIVISLIICTIFIVIGSDKASGLKKYLNPFKSNGAWTWENPDPAVNLLRTLRLGTVSLPRPVRDSRKVPSGEDPDETDKNLDDWLEEYVEGIEE